MDKYKDIINLPHFESKTRKKMTLEERSAQFAPFSALVGYDDLVKEKARLTDKKIILSEEELLELNNTLSLLNDKIKNKPLIEVTYFIKDKKKNGGHYNTIKDNFKRIDNVYKDIYLINYKISIKDIYNIKIIDNE